MFIHDLLQDTPFIIEIRSRIASQHNLVSTALDLLSELVEQLDVFGITGSHIGRDHSNIESHDLKCNFTLAQFPLGLAHVFYRRERIVGIIEVGRHFLRQIMRRHSFGMEVLRAPARDTI